MCWQTASSDHEGAQIIFPTAKRPTQCSSWSLKRNAFHGFLRRSIYIMCLLVDYLNFQLQKHPVYVGQEWKHSHKVNSHIFIKFCDQMCPLWTSASTTAALKVLSCSLQLAWSEIEEIFPVDVTDKLVVARIYPCLPKLSSEMIWNPSVNLHDAQVSFLPPLAHRQSPVMAVIQPSAYSQSQRSFQLWSDPRNTNMPHSYHTPQACDVHGGPGWLSASKHSLIGYRENPNHSWDIFE